MLEGVDLSSYQATTPDLAGLSFAIPRASINVAPDVMYANHAHAIRKAGLELGAYHFGRHGDVTGQLRTFLTASSVAPPDFYVLDLEGSGPTAMTESEARAFIAAMPSPCGLYGSESGYPSLGQAFRWVANWAKAPSIPWDLWQYTSSGHLPGYSGRLDRDRFDGTLAEFRIVTRGHTGGGNTGGDMKYVNANASAVASGQLLNVGAGHEWLYMDGSHGGTFAGDAALVCLGRADTGAGQFVCQITTAVPYADGVARQTLVLVATTNAPYAAPPVVVDCTAAVKAQSDRDIAAVTAAKP